MWYQPLKCPLREKVLTTDKHGQTRKNRIMCPMFSVGQWISVVNILHHGRLSLRGRRYQPLKSTDMHRKTELCVRCSVLVSEFQWSIHYTTIRGVAQLVAHHVRDVGVGRSSRLSSTAKAPFEVLLLLLDDSDENATKGVPEHFYFLGKRRNDGRLMLHIAILEI